MESQRIYQESYNELARIMKEATSNQSIRIDLRKLDMETQALLKDAVYCTACKRKGEVYKVISGVQNS